LNDLTRILIGIILMFSAGSAHSEPVEYTFSTTDPISIPSVLEGLTSVSGSFIYENAAVPIETEPSSGNTVYGACGSLSGSANGNSYSAPVFGIVVGDDTFEGSRDFFLLGSNTLQNLSGFTFRGMPLIHIFIFWIEGQEGIPDFLDDQSLPSVLPPTISGRLALGFGDPRQFLRFLT
jgi:hypothetical protein